MLATVGLIGSLAGIAARSSELPCATRVLLVIALAGLAAGALLALLVAHPRHLREVHREDLRGALEPDRWNTEAEENLRLATLVRLDILERFRNANEVKAKYLSAALISVGASVGFLLVAVAVLLIVGASP